MPKHRPPHLVDADSVPQLRLSVNWTRLGKILGVLVAIGSLGGMYSSCASDMATMKESQRSTEKRLDRIEDRIQKIGDRLGVP